MERIYLVGFMGAGKSSVGRELADRLGWAFFDLDREIEKAAQAAVREIFDRFGEAHFRALEREHLQRLSAAPRAVIASGGGAYMDETNRMLMDSTGVTVWLKVSFANAVRRGTMDGTRPLFQNLDEAEHLYRRRLESYGLSRIHVATDDREPAEIAAEIARRLSAVEERREEL